MKKIRIRRISHFIVNLSQQSALQTYNRLLDAWTTDQFLTDSRPRRP